MKPAPVDLPIIWRASDWAAVVLKWKDVNGNPLNLTGWTPTANTTQFDLNAVVTDVTGGVTQISLNKFETAAADLGVYQWNWIFAHASGIVTPPVLAGNVEVKDPIKFVP